MSSYSEALQDFYAVEVFGETVYSAMVGLARDDEERLKWAALLQLETETKAWLRAPMIARGLSIEEPAGERQKAAALVEQVKSLSWMQLMEALRDTIERDLVRRYQSYAEAARARGSAAEEAVCTYMVEHEMAQVEFARRELAGAGLDESLQPVEKFLKYPLRG